MTVHIETLCVGSRKFIVKIKENDRHFYASCTRIPGLITTGQSIAETLSHFFYFTEMFFNDFVEKLPLKERKKICLWMQ